KSPTVNSINGPTSLAVGETGRWTVDASDPEGYPLAYSFSSGDMAAAAIVRIGEIAQGFTDVQSFVHSYGTPGLYTVTAEVQDSAGNTAQSSIRVSVGGGASSSGAFPGATYVPEYSCGAECYGANTPSQYSFSPQNTSSSGSGSGPNPSWGNGDSQGGDGGSGSCTFDGLSVPAQSIVVCSSSRGRELASSHMACMGGKWASIGTENVRSFSYESIGDGVLDTVTCKLSSPN
ncbi:MAG: PKD domain-containing protein, partial [Patescibacteria group bacterium]|nr:PKD domain-containing protein [Patescibacteria group bacterium]